MPVDDDDREVFDCREDENDEGLPGNVAEIIERLRDTLTFDMARRMIPNRFGVTPTSDDEIEALMEELIADAYNDGYDSWEKFPY